MTDTRNFYEKIFRFPIALDQGGCIIFQLGKYGYWGFCETDKEIVNPEQVCLTVVVETPEEVDEWDNYLRENNIIHTREPQETAQYKIYNAFYEDPTGYTLEIQAFAEDGRPKGHEDF
jgi:hypothetical protein